MKSSIGKEHSMKKIFITIGLIALPIAVERIITLRSAAIASRERRKRESFCPSCKKIFGFLQWKHSCTSCGELRCSDCLRNDNFKWLTLSIKESLSSKNFNICSNCLSGEMGDEFRRYDLACNEAKKVIFHYAYNDTPVAEEVKLLTTTYFENRYDAKRQLATTARFLNCDYVCSVDFSMKTKQVERFDPYHHSRSRYILQRDCTVWAATGIAAKSNSTTSKNNDK